MGEEEKEWRKGYRAAMQDIVAHVERYYADFNDGILVQTLDDIQEYALRMAANHGEDYE